MQPIILAIPLFLAAVACAGASPRQEAAAPGEPSMHERQVAALTEMARAVSAGDAAAYARLYAQDAVITIFGGGDLRGREAVERYEVDLLREFPGARLAFYAVWHQGPLAVVHYAVHGKAAQAQGGASMGHEGLLFFRFAPSGMIAEEHRYLDSLTPMTQLGVLSSAQPRTLPTLPDTMESHVAGGSPSEEQNVKTVTASLTSLASGDEAAFLATLGEDAVLDDLTRPQPIEGKPGIRKWLESWNAAVSDARCEITTIVGAGDFVLAETLVHGTLNGSLGIVAASDKAFAVHRAAIVRVKEGRIDRVSLFLNAKELAVAVVQWPLPEMKARIPR